MYSLDDARPYIKFQLILLADMRGKRRHLIARFRRRTSAIADGPQSNSLSCRHTTFCVRFLFNDLLASRMFTMRGHIVQDAQCWWCIFPHFSQFVRFVQSVPLGGNYVTLYRNTVIIKVGRSMMLVHADFSQVIPKSIPSRPHLSSFFSVPKIRVDPKLG